MKTLFQKMRDNRQRILRAPGQNPSGRVEKIVGEAMDQAKTRAAVWRFLDNGGKLNGVSKGLVGEDDIVVLFPDNESQPVEFTAEEYNREVLAWKAEKAKASGAPIQAPPEPRNSAGTKTALGSTETRHEDQDRRTNWCAT